MLLRAKPRNDTLSGIPHILHQVWLGDNPIPHEYQAYSDRLRAMHPGFEYRLWTDATPPPGVDNPDFLRSKNPAFRSDIWRLLILQKHGGVYADLDFEALRPLTGIVDACDAFIGATFPNNGFMGITVENAVIGAIPNHPFIEAALAALPQSIEDHFAEGESSAIVNMTGPGLLSRVLEAYRQTPESIRSDVAVLPPRVLYPVWGEPGQQRVLSGEMLGIHHWSGSWWNLGL